MIFPQKQNGMSKQNYLNIHILTHTPLTMLHQISWRREQNILIQLFSTKLVTYYKVRTVLQYKYISQYITYLSFINSNLAKMQTNEEYNKNISSIFLVQYFMSYMDGYQSSIYLIMQDEVLSPILDEQQRQENQSYQFLVSKHLISPPLMLLPKLVDNKPKSLLPMIPLPTFVGIIPNFQPLDKPLIKNKNTQQVCFNWIGQAFDKIVFRKYDETSYLRLQGIDENWNIWVCDVGKLMSQNQKSNQIQTNEVRPFYELKQPSDKTLIFQSRFESGNLSLVSKVQENEYNLLLQNDINTNGYAQWFFFKVNNTFAGNKVKFNILNMYKQNSLYKVGMKIIIYSVKESEEKNISWHRGGENISYYENGYSKSKHQFKPFYSLSWQYTFPHSGDEVYFAYNYPFTYSNLESIITKIQSDTFLRNICQRSLLCKTAAGNRVDVLTITEDHPFMELDKKYIVITSRIHPGQSVSSYVCNGILQFLLSNNEKARKLRHNFIFKIVPMLNPDGVIHGNYRSNVTGYDLNRKWQNPSKIYHPEIYYLKKMIIELEELSGIMLFCDLHGHSMKKNAFIYGCHDINNPEGGKLFPLLVSKLFKGFSFKDCSFLVKEEKEGTSRSVLSKELPHQNIYTLQSSFCGPQHENIHFTVRHFEDLGEKFCQSILICFKNDIKEMQIEAAMKEKSYFPQKQSSMESIDGQDPFEDINLNRSIMDERVNSQNSQGSQQENQLENLISQKTIKRQLFLRSQRPSTTTITRKSSLNGVIKHTLSKQLGGIIFRKSVEFNIHKSISPIKRKELYDQPKVEKVKNISPVEKRQKHNIQPKLFVPIEFAQFPLQAHQKNYRSSHMSQKIKREEIKVNFKVIQTKNNKDHDGKEKDNEDEPTVFRNSSLKGLIREKKQSDFMIRKANKVPYNNDKNSTNLFKNVLLSLRKDKK